MEIQNKKCSSKKHDIDAINYCDSCKIFMCNKCSNLHSELFESHQPLKLSKDMKEIFTGVCKESSHKDLLNYFCKTHNILCCAACISKIKSKGNGLHQNCDIYNIEEIKEEKKNKLEENIKYLEDLTKTLDKSIKELKEIYEEISKNKEEIKLKIQKIFTRIRTALNDREDELLLEVDNIFDEKFFNEDIIKLSEKIPNKIKSSLEKGKLINNKWDDNNELYSLINDCINIENNIKNIKLINEHTNKYNFKDNPFKFMPDEEKEINYLLDIIKSFGSLQNKSNSLGKLLKENDIELISNWIKSDNQEIKKVNFQLCYDAKTNGDDKNAFYKYCINIGPSLLVIKTKSNYIFGGYTKENWEISNQVSYKKDNTAFLFSLNNKERIKVRNSDRAIVNDNNYGPIFGHGNAYEICLFYPFLSTNIQIFDKGDYGDKNLILTGNKSNKPIEIEMYRVSFK